MVILILYAGKHMLVGAYDIPSKAMKHPPDDPAIADSYQIPMDTKQSKFCNFSTLQGSVQT